MNSRKWRGPLLLALAVFGFSPMLAAARSGPAGPLAQPAPPLPPPSSNVAVYATGLNSPRGLKFGPDGLLYVAEAGVGGATSAVGQCQQVPAPVGPYTGSATGARVSRIAPDGTRSTVVDNIPSSTSAPGAGSVVLGAEDVDWVGGQLYVLTAGGGCSHGVPGVPNGVIKANSDGSWSPVADLSAYQHAHPTAVIEPDDFEPDGTWYSLLAVDGVLYAIEPNHGELDKITPDGQISRVADISASQGHAVPTVMTFHAGTFYVGNLYHFPIVPGSSHIYQVTPAGKVSIFANGLTTVLGIAFDSQGQLYALEMSAAAGMPAPGAGRVVRVDSAGQLTPVASGLSLATGMTFGPDGKLYISQAGFGLPPGAGQILRVDLAAGAAPGMPRTGTPGDGTGLLLLAGLLLLLGLALRRPGARPRVARR